MTFLFGPVLCECCVPLYDILIFKLVVLMFNTRTMLHLKQPGCM